ASWLNRTHTSTAPSRSTSVASVSSTGSPCPRTVAGRASSATSRAVSQRAAVTRGSAAGRPRIETRAVVPEDLGLALVAHALEGDELVHRVGEQAVGVGIVGRHDDVVVADRLHDLAQYLLVGVGGHIALAEEVLARPRRDLDLGAGTEFLPRFVQTPEPPRQPPARALQECAAQAGVALEHAGGGETSEGQHQLYGVAGGAADQSAVRVIEHAAPDV